VFNINSDKTSAVLELFKIANADVEETQKKEEPKTQDEKPHFLRLQDIEVVDRSKIVSIKTGIDALDRKIIGMNKGELSIWSGGNGSGKSTFLSQLALETIERGFRVAMFSGELTSNRAKSWLQLQAAGRQNTLLSDNNISYYVPKAKAEAIDIWAADKLWLYNNQYGIKVNSVIDDFKKHFEEYDTDVVIIDNLMSLDLTEIKGEKYDRQTALVLMLSELAKAYNVHIHFVCHPRKPVGFLRKSDISGSADLTNAADNVFMMHRVNNDFLRLGGEFLGKTEIEQYKEFSNVIEIMKNRDLGVSDDFVGLYFEPSSKRMLNEKHENKLYGWESEDLSSLPW
jgi:replicative DNA helicase